MFLVRSIFYKVKMSKIRMNTNLQKIQKAISVVFKEHEGQYRKGTQTPYIVHLLDVSSILMYEEDLDENVICAGILHDTLEDTHYTKEQLQEDFGNEVCKLVLFCTEDGNTVDTSKEEEVRTWKVRKEKSLEKLTQGAKEEEMLVFLADKLSNIKSMYEEKLIVGDEFWNKFNASYEEIKWYYTQILELTQDVLSKRRVHLLYSHYVGEVFQK